MRRKFMDGGTEEKVFNVAGYDVFRDDGLGNSNALKRESNNTPLL